MEFGHFFAAMGARVTIIEMTDRMVASEEPEISALLLRELGKRIEVHMSTQATAVKSTAGSVTVVTKNAAGETRDITAAKLMVAVERSCNADTLDLEKTGIKVDRRGFIEVDAYLETSASGIYALGDANGQQMFTHMANYEADVVGANLTRGKETTVDYHAAPHAVFSHPQIASVGLRQADVPAGRKILIGQAPYNNVVKSEAMKEEDGFTKAIVEAETDTFLGFHIIGPYAPMLIQEVTNVMTSGGTVEDLFRGIHIHPAMPELIPPTLGSLSEPS